MIKIFLTKQFLAYLMTGGFAAIVHWASRIILNNWFSFSTAVIISYFIGMFTAFMINTFFVFSHSRKKRIIQARDFFVVNMIFFPIVWFLSIIINNFFVYINFKFFAYEISHGIAVSFPMLATFVIYKFFTFRDFENEK